MKRSIGNVEGLESGNVSEHQSIWEFMCFHIPKRSWENPNSIKLLHEAFSLVPFYSNVRKTGGAGRVKLLPVLKVSTYSYAEPGIPEKNNELSQKADWTCPDDFHCSGRAGISIIVVHSLVQNGWTVLIQIPVPPRCIPECAPSMFAIPDDALESPEHIPTQLPAGERSTLLSAPRYHTPGIQSGAQAQER